MWTQSGDRPAAKPEGPGFRQRIGAKTRMASHGPPRLWEAACTFSEALEQLEHKELVSSRNSASLRHEGCLALPAFLSPHETHFPDVRSTRPTARAKCRVKERTRHGASDRSKGGGNTSPTPQAHFRALYGGRPWGLLPSRHCQALSPIRRAGGKQACQDLGSPGWLGEEGRQLWGAQAPAPHPGGRPQLEAVLRARGQLWPSPRAGASPPSPHGHHCQCLWSETSPYQSGLQSHLAALTEPFAVVLLPLQEQKDEPRAIQIIHKHLVSLTWGRSFRLRQPGTSLTAGQ